MVFLRKFLSVLIILSLPLMIGCTNSSSDDDDDSSGSTPSNSSESGTPSAGNFRTDCGTVVDGSLENPARGEDGERVTIRNAGDHNAVVVTRNGSEQLIKLRALANSVSSSVDSRARNLINGFSGRATLFTDECVGTVAGGGVAFVGELFSSSGQSITEALIKAGVGKVSGSGGCGESEVVSCYRALEDDAEPEPGARVTNFLWKPRSERNGNLVVLLNPGGATVIANGTTLSNSGASNGRGTTARANRPGSSFGSNVTVQAFDRSGRPLVFPGGTTSYNIPNGGSRVEF